MSRGRIVPRRGAVLATALAVGAGIVGPTGASADANTDPSAVQPEAASSVRPDAADAQRYRSKGDPRGDVKFPVRNRPIDIVRMEGWPHSRDEPRYATVRIFGRAFPGTSGKRNLADVYINLRGTGPKPDFRVVKYLPRDRDGLDGVRLLRVRGWNQNVRVKPCPDLVVPFDARRDRVTFFIPRGCVNARNGRRFQIHARMWNVTRYTDSGQPERGWFDEVPNRLRRSEPRFLGGWV